MPSSIEDCITTTLDCVTKEVFMEEEGLVPALKGLMLN